MSLASPLLALAITIVIGFALFTILGKDPVRGLEMFFIEPVKSLYGISEVLVKATPLVLIALGLSVCFRSNIWNIGAEGQFIVGAVFGSGVAMRATESSGRVIVVAILAAGVVGGMLWAAITAFLRDRFNASEILVSLMLVYVADLFLGFLVYGPWKDPAGYNFPQTITFLKVTKIPRLFEGLRTHLGTIIALFAVGGFWCSSFERTPAFSCKWGASLRSLPVTRGSRRGELCGQRSSCRVGWRGSQVRSKRAARWVSSPRTSQRGTGSRPSSWRSSAGCTRWGSCSQPCS